MNRDLCRAIGINDKPRSNAHLYNVNKIEGLKEQSEALIAQIRSIETCPTCKQKVEDAHKEKIRSEESSKAGNRQEAKRDRRV